MAFKTSDICDALASAQACLAQFRSFGQRKSFGGHIRTLRCFEDIADLRALVNERGDGCVLVVDGGGSLDCALFGDRMAASLVRNGWAGAIINGAVRDTAEIDDMAIGLKALGTMPRRGHQKGGGAVDVPITFGGATFVPGHYVLADEDGVIVLPERMTPADLDRANPDPA